MFSFGLWVDALTKAVGHKYIKRIPYQSKGKRRYRYIYKVTHSHQGRHAFDEAHLQEGTAFSLSTKAGEEFHGHVTKIEGDQVSYRIDDGPEKGTVKTTSKRELLAKLNDVHDIESQLTSERDKLRNQIKEARKNKASEKQIARLESRLSRLGGKQEGEVIRGEVIRGEITPEDIRQYKQIDKEGAGAFTGMSTADLQRLKDRFKHVIAIVNELRLRDSLAFDKEAGLYDAEIKELSKRENWDRQIDIHDSEDEPRDGADYQMMLDFYQAKSDYEDARRELEELESKLSDKRERFEAELDSRYVLPAPLGGRRGDEIMSRLTDELNRREYEEQERKERAEATRRQQEQERKERAEAEKKAQRVQMMIDEARKIDRIVEEGDTGEAYEKKTARRGYEAETPSELYEEVRDNIRNVDDADDYTHALSQVEALVQMSRISLEQGYLLRRMLRAINPLKRTPEELDTEEAEEYEALKDKSDILDDFLDLYEEE